MKPRIKVVDVPTTAADAEAEAILNGPCEDGYYCDKIVLTGLPEGVGCRGFYRLRMKPE